MIISHKHRFIFIKTYKTAGTSVEIWLSSICGKEDIITPISPADELLRAEYGGRGPQNYYIALDKYTLKDILSLLRGKRAVFYNHMAAFEILKYLDQETWRSYYKFCFERNPWDRVLSYYYWRYQKEPRPTLDEFVRTRPPRLLEMRGYDLYTIDSQVVVDRVFRYEELNEAMKEVADTLGVAGPTELPRAKSDTRTDRRSYREVMSSDIGDLIAERYREEISLLGYEY